MKKILTTKHVASFENMCTGLISNFNNPTTFNYFVKHELQGWIEIKVNPYGITMGDSSFSLPFAQENAPQMGTFDYNNELLNKITHLLLKEEVIEICPKGKSAPVMHKSRVARFVEQDENFSFDEVLIYTDDHILVLDENSEFIFVSLDYKSKAPALASWLTIEEAVREMEGADYTVYLVEK